MNDQCQTPKPRKPWELASLPGIERQSGDFGQEKESLGNGGEALLLGFHFGDFKWIKKSTHFTKSKQSTSFSQELMITPFIKMMEESQTIKLFGLFLIVLLFMIR